LWRGDLAIIWGVLRHFPAFSGISGVFRHIDDKFPLRVPDIWGGSNPCPLFWSVENKRAKMGGNSPLSPLKTLFLVSS
jgi:hypothetical protein